MTILETNSLKNEILNNVRNEISKLSDKPFLAIISDNLSMECKSYLQAIKKMCVYINCNYKHYNYENKCEKDILNLISKLNNDNNVTSILLCLPLSDNLDKDKIINSISSNKDVDGLTDENIFNNNSPIISSTAQGIICLLEHYKINVKGKSVLIINRSKLIGIPLAKALLKKDATVTIAHSKTSNLDDYLILADIVITAVGKGNFIDSTKVKEKSIIIDAGISYINDKIVGDFKYLNNKDIYLTKIPNGVGNMTIAALAQNILKCYYINKLKK